MLMIARVGVFVARHGMTAVRQACRRRAVVDFLAAAVDMIAIVQRRRLRRATDLGRGWTNFERRMLGNGGCRK